MAIPAFHRTADGNWREVTPAEHTAIMERIAAAPCPSTLDNFPGDERAATCALPVHSRLRMHEDATGTRRWSIDDSGNVHASAKPGSDPLYATCDGCGHPWHATHCEVGRGDGEDCQCAEAY